MDDQTVAISETQQKNYLGDRTILRRHYQLGNGDTVTQARVQNGNWASRWEAVETWDLPSKEGTIWYYDPACVLIDLASAPGGIDASQCLRRSLQFTHARGLPGKTAPATAGRLIAQTVARTLTEQEAL